jgi:hypothetical protein
MKVKWGNKLFFQARKGKYLASTLSFHTRKDEQNRIRTAMIWLGFFYFWFIQFDTAVFILFGLESKQIKNPNSSFSSSFFIFKKTIKKNENFRLGNFGDNWWVKKDKRW